MTTLSARDRAEILWKQHTRQAESPEPARATDHIDAKTARLRRLRLAREAADEGVSGSGAPGDRWFANYGRHLALLYAPKTSFPEDLDRLIEAVSARIAART
jgi:hypothetical protein